MAKTIPIPSKVKLKSADEVSEFAENLINTIQEPLIALDKDLRVIKASCSFYDFFKVTPDETIGTLIYDLGNGQWNIPKLRELLETILPEKTTFDNYEVEHDFSTIGKRIMLLNARKIKRGLGKEQIILLAIEDITERKLAEELVGETSRVTDEYLDILFNHAYAPMIIWDTSLVITHINHAFEKLSGYDRAELKDKKIDILFPKDKIGTTLELIKDTLLSDERSEIIEIDILTKNKDLKTVLWNPANILDKEGKYIVATIAQDITQRKQTEGEIAMLAHSLRSINECVCITDMDDKLIFANESFLKMYGFNENELIGKHMSVVRSPNNPMELVGEILPATLRGGWKGELWNKRKDGSEFLIYLSTTIINDKEGKPLGLIGVANDITERKRTEKELIEAREKAESANKLKDAFIANISHEIRTPLNGIMGMASLIRDTFSTNISKEDKELFEGIDISGKRIIRTVDMILNYSRLQVGEFQIRRKEIELSGICENLVKEFTVTVKLKSLQLTFQNKCTDATIFADEYTITMAISNLIDNAIKYTQKGFITIILYKSNNDDIILEIKDTGIGISEEYLNKLFEPYQQEHMGYVRAYEGIGLGLALVNKILILNNAALFVESKKGEGSTFSINFGKEVQQGKKATEINIMSNVPVASEKMGTEVVLLLEDDTINQITIKRFLGDIYTTIITGSSDDALEILKKKKVDMILMDISIMGKKNGLELTKDLKASKAFSHIPVIAITAHAFEKDKQNALEAGCDSYLAKPFTRESLLNLIAGYARK